jgi:hypothetical protein
MSVALCCESVECTNVFALHNSVPLSFIVSGYSYHYNNGTVIGYTVVFGCCYYYYLYTLYLRVLADPTPRKTEEAPKHHAVVGCIHTFAS